MAKGSVRKKGKKWYYRFYVEDASGNSVQREFPGSESKSETEAMLRKAMASQEPAYQIVVDNPTSRENVTRYAEHQGYQVACVEHGGEYTLSITK